MMLDISIKPSAFILKQKMLYRKIEGVLYVYKGYPIPEEPIYNGNSCHAVASYDSSEK